MLTSRRDAPRIRAPLLAGLSLAMFAHLAQAVTDGPHQLPVPPNFEPDGDAIVFRVDFAPSAVSLLSVNVVDGPALARLGNPPQLRIRMEHNDGTLIEESDAWDPRFVFGEDGPGQQTVVMSQAVGTFILPFSELLARTVISDVASDEVLIVIALSDLEFLAFDPAPPPDVPAEALIGTPITFDLSMAVANNGPAAPIDAEVALTITSDPGISVTPTSSTVPAGPLAIGSAVLSKSLTAECLAPGIQEFTVNATLSAVNGSDYDLDTSNNSGSATFSIDCVVPVAINIKPGSNPNSARMNKRHPVAVLTTEAGEYNLPLDFDATTILPLTARFGPRDAVFMGTAGAAEVHGKGHVEDSRELTAKEKERDGDDDMVLHFDLSDSGLAGTETEACMKGEFVDLSSGDTFRFFGCDAIRLLP